MKHFNKIGYTVVMLIFTVAYLVMEYYFLNVLRDQWAVPLTELSFGGLLFNAICVVGFISITCTGALLLFKGATKGGS